MCTACARPVSAFAYSIRYRFDFDHVFVFGYNGKWFQLYIKWGVPVSSFVRFRSICLAGRWWINKNLPDFLRSFLTCPVHLWPHSNRNTYLFCFEISPFGSLVDGWRGQTKLDGLITKWSIGIFFNFPIIWHWLKCIGILEQEFATQSIRSFVWWIVYFIFCHIFFFSNACLPINRALLFCRRFC